MENKKGYPLRDELAFLAGAIVPGDTWATFRAFCNYWGWSASGYGKVSDGHLFWRTEDKYLRRVADGFSHEIQWLIDDILDDLAGPRPRGAWLAKAVSSLIPPTASEDMLLVKGLFSNEKFVEAVNGFETRINNVDKRLNEMRGAPKRQMIISYVVIALLLGIFFFAR